jgi:hypothetical protein
VALWVERVQVIVPSFGQVTLSVRSLIPEIAQRMGTRFIQAYRLCQLVVARQYLVGVMIVGCKCRVGITTMQC